MEARTDLNTPHRAGPQKPVTSSICRARCYGGRMCDMNEEEFAEYLRWLEAARVRESARPARVRRTAIPVAIEAPALASVEGTT